jgi:hypothetical protein
MRTMPMLYGGLLLGLFLGGCADENGPTTRPMTAYERSENALKDPFGYSPDVGKPDDITAGSGAQFDRKAFDKDANDVLNP